MQLPEVYLKMKQTGRCFSDKLVSIISNHDDKTMWLCLTLNIFFYSECKMQGTHVSILFMKEVIANCIT